MTWKRGNFKTSCCRSRKLLDICRHRLLWFDQIYYKFFNSKLCNKAWLKHQYIFKKKKVRILNSSRTHRAMCPTWINNFTGYSFMIKYTKITVCRTIEWFNFAMFYYEKRNLSFCNAYFRNLDYSLQNRRCFWLTNLWFNQNRSQ